MGIGQVWLGPTVVISLVPRLLLTKLKTGDILQHPNIYTLTDWLEAVYAHFAATQS